MAIYISYLLFSFCDKSEAGKLTCRQMTFAAFAALIRGAIAFGLVTQLGDEVAEREVLVSSTLALVIITTVVFGGITGFVQRCLLPSPGVDDDHSETLEAQEQLLQNELTVKGNINEQVEEPSGDASVSVYHQFLHPNQDQNKETEQEVESQGFFARIDDKYLRPFLVYKYHKLKKQPKYEMEDMLNEYNMIQRELLSDDSEEEE